MIEPRVGGRAAWLLEVRFVPSGFGDGAELIEIETCAARLGLARAVIGHEIAEQRMFGFTAHWVHRAQELRAATNAQVLQAYLDDPRLSEPALGEPGDWIPAFFASGRYDRFALADVSQALRDFPSSMKLQFFVTPRGLLDGRSPLQAIEAGELARVIELAHGNYVEDWGGRPGTHDR